MNRFSFCRLAIVVFLVALVPRAAAYATITIDTVPVGDMGNPNDPATGNLYGGVNYAYSIGKYEVTVGQYVEFLNAIAATDTYGLYNSSAGAISRVGSPGAYSYSVIGSSKIPVSQLFWRSVARFANWLHNGQPTGAQNS